MQEQYTNTNFHFAQERWSPCESNHYTPLAFIHHKGNTGFISVAPTLVASGNLSKNQLQCSSISYHSKNISEIFLTTPKSPYFILIEGVPGIGKTFLSKEIAYQWAENKLLKSKLLVFLLLLRDPNVKNKVLLRNLTEYLLNNKRRSSDLSEYLIETNGKDLTIILDGYDEIFEQGYSLVAKIIKRQILRECDLIITSRPSACQSLRSKADCRIEMLGFAEEDRLDYIQHALKVSDYKIKALQFYLQSNPAINALSYIPLNMTILLCLLEEVMTSSDKTWDLNSIREIGLPKTQTEMYKKFILKKIIDFIAQRNPSFLCCLKEFSDLSEPYNKIFNELLELAYSGLTRDKIVFNLHDEVVNTCPIIKSGSYEGLGLLQVTKHVNNISFNFLHFSIQEYLAAYYIASLSTNRQIQLLRSTFWNIHYFNTWIMFVGITGGKTLAWKHFISGNWFMLSTKLFRSKIVSKCFLNDKVKSLHLFQCLAEIGDQEFGRNIFKDKIIDLSGQTLLPKDINTICFFLLRSGIKHWMQLSLSNCNIGDIGCDILCKTLLYKLRHIVHIDKIDLSHNQLRIHSISALLDAFKNWHTLEATISWNHDNDNNLFRLCLKKFSLYIDEDFSQTVLVGSFLFAHNNNVHDWLINSKDLSGLYLSHSNCPSTSLAYEELSYKFNLSKLHIICENMQNCFMEAIVQTLKEFDSVYIYDHTLSDETVECISSMLYKINSNLGIWVVIGGTKVLGNIPNMFTLNEQLLPTEIFNLTENIRRLNSSSSMCTTNFSLAERKSVFEDFFNLLCNVSKCEINFCLVEKNVLIANKIKYHKIREVLSSNSDLISIYIRKCQLSRSDLKEFTNLIRKLKSLEKLYVFDSSLEMHSFVYENLLNQTLKLKEMFIHNTKSSCALTFNLLEIQQYPNVSVLLIVNNTLIGHNPTNKQILLSLDLVPNLIIWKVCNFYTNIELFERIVNALSNVVDLHIVQSNLGEYKLQQCDNEYDDEQHNFNRIIKEPVNNITKILCYFKKLQVLNLCHNDLQEDGIGKISNNLSISTLIKLNISHTKIDEQAVDYINKLLSQNPDLEELDLSCNKLQVTGTIRLLNVIQTTSRLKMLDISNNYLNYAASHGIATFLSHNAQLKELDLSYNNLEARGAKIICKGMGNLLSLTKFNVSNNNISSEAADDIAVVLSKNKSLKELDLSYNNLEPLGSLCIFNSLKETRNLTKLNVCGIGMTNIVAHDITTVLNNNKNLKKLDLSHNNIQTEGASYIFKNTTTKNLQKLNISYNNITDDVDGTETFLLSNTDNLEEFDCSHNDLRYLGAKKIFRTYLPKLTYFNISYNNLLLDAADDIPCFLYWTNKLEMLDLSGNDLQEQDVKNIFNELQKNSDLFLLKLSHSNVIGKAADKLAVLLNNITLLQELDLSYNNISTSDAIKIFEGMKNIYNLKTINISHNMITDKAAMVIVDVLSHNNKLRSLDLSCNYFSCKGFEIFDSLKNVLYLKNLNISTNEITVKAAHSISTVLSHNSQLEELDLGNNFMQTEGTIIIFRNLRDNFNLKKIYINNNMITDDAADDIVIILSQNTKLEELDISWNNLQSAGAIKIFKGVKHISTLTKLNIAHNMITDEATQYIVNGLSSNSELKKLNLSHNNIKTAIFFKGLKLVGLTEFNCSGNNIDEHSANEISFFLSHCTNLQVLDLSCTNLQYAGGIKVLNISNNNLIKFNIGGNDITTNAAHKIAVFLSNNYKLEELDLSCNNLQELGIRSILESIKLIHLTKLSISNNQISCDLKHIADVLTLATKLKELDLSYNKLSADHMTHFLYETKNIFANLIKLNVSGNVISDGAAEALADALSENTKLKELDLSNNNLHAEGISKIFNGLKISTLLKLNISHNNVTDKAADDIANFLSRNVKLENLDISHNNLQSHDATKIFTINNIVKLTTFNIGCNNITTEAANDIAAFLSRNKKLVELDLSYNKLLSTGVIEICMKLSSIFNLVKFNISHNNITTEAIDVIGDFLFHNTKLQILDLSKNDLQGSGCWKDFIKNLQYNSNLLGLKLSNSNIIKEAADELAIVLLNNPKLKELDLSYNNSDMVKIFKGMKNISNLVSINVSHNMITNEAADELATVLLHNTSLQEINLSYNNLSTSDAVKIFKGMKNISNLVSISLSHNMITDETADELAAVLLNNTELNELNLCYSNLTIPEIVKIFKGMKNISHLVTIHISHNTITDKAADELAFAFCHNTSLQQLDLSYNNLSTLDAVKIFKGMKHFSNLVTLNVSHNMITDEAADELAIVLLNNTSLQDITLSFNGLTTSGAIKVFNGMINISNLTALNISHNMITDEAAENVAVILSRNNNLELLNLSYNYFRSKGCIKVFNGMKSIIYLRKLDISCNQINTFKAAECIANFLLHNSKMEELDISNNFMQATAIRKVFKSMRNISKLRKLYIHHNMITNEVADDIAVILSQNARLEELDISHNNLQTSGATKIFQGITHISTLTKLNIAHNMINDEATKCILDILSTNSKLKELKLNHNNLVISDLTKCSFTNLQEVDLSCTNLQTAVSIDGLNVVSLRKCNISGNCITASEANRIANFLSKNDELKQIDLSCNNLQELGTRYILNSIRITNLTKLNISNNQISCDLKHIAGVLTLATKLEELDLSYNKLSTDHIKHFLYETKNIFANLIKLNVSGNVISDGAAEALADALSENTKLKELDLSINNLRAEGISKIFNGLRISTLLKLNISHNNVTDKAADDIANFISRNTKLENLNVSHSNLHDNDAKKILEVNLSKLTTFNISQNSITSEIMDDIAEFLSYSTKIQIFDLSFNDVQDLRYTNIFKVLQNIASLTSLKFSDCNVTNKAAGKLATVLFHNTLLQKLDLSFTSLTASSVIKIFKKMIFISNLTALNISHNMITDEAAENIATILSRNNNLELLNLSNNYLRSNGCIKVFNGIKNIYLRKLNISCNHITSFEAAECIGNFLLRNSEMEELDISNNFMQAAAIRKVFKSMRNISKLRKLYIHHNMINNEVADDIAVILSQNARLEELDISHNNLQTSGAAKIFQGITHISTLTKLNIAHNMIDDEATKCILDILSTNSKLKELKLNHNNLVISDLTKCSFTNLQEVDLSCTNLQTAVSIDGLNVVSLRKCKISGNCITASEANRIANFLSKNDELKQLDLSCNNLQELGTRYILNSIRISNLTKLSISNNQVSSDLKHIADVLTLATKLEELDLSYNKLSANHMNHFLYETKNIFANLIKLNVSGNVISDGAAEALADALSENTKLKELDLSDNNLHAEGISKIFNGLRISTLLKLNISHNNVTDKAADDIANFISRNTKLENLNVSHNTLQDSEAKKIFKVNISKLTTFNISQNNITSKVTDDMAEFLSHNTQLKIFDISYNDLLELENIFKVLQNISILTSLKLSNCNVFNKAADELATVLLYNIILQEFDMSYNRLSTSDAVKIFKGMKSISYLITLNISHNMITDEAADELAIVLLNNTSLQKIDLSFNHLTASGAIKIFKGMINILNLTALNISHNLITDEAAENVAVILSRNNNLELLNLSYNYFRSKGCIKVFNGMKNIIYLRKLNISCNQINTLKAACCISNFLLHNSEMEELDISNNFMQATAIRKVFKSMRNISKLRKLYIHHNMINNEVADDIAVILSQNARLEELDISHNNLQTSGAAKIFQGITHISTLTKLNIAHNMIDDEATKCILDILSTNSKLKELKLNHNNLVISDLTKCSFTNLQEVDLSCTNLQTAVSIDGLNVVSLRKCNISGNYITASEANRIANFLSKNDELKQLDLSCNNLQELGTRYILNSIRISNLTKLSISNNQVSSDLKHIADVLTLATKLEELDLSYNKLSANHMKHFLYETKNVFANLIKLNVSGNVISDGAAEALADALSENTKLKELDLSDNNLHAEGISKIFNGLRISTLIKLNISHNNVTDKAADDIANFISRNTKLENLNVSHNTLQDSDAKKIFKVNISKLTTFNISQNNITSKVTDDMAEFLSHNTQLKIFDISYNDLQELGYRNIFKVLQNISSFTSLKLSNCNVFNKAADELATVLLYNIILQEVDMSYNRLSTSDAVKIFKGMKRISYLVTLNISHNNITDEAANELSTVLLNNTSLQKIDLSYNNLSTPDAVKIFKGMKNITNLISFNFSHNTITDEAADELANILSQNVFLQELNLNYNNLSTSDSVKIFKGMKYIFKLKTINISHNMITDEAAGSISDVLFENSNLETLNLSSNCLRSKGSIKIFNGMRNILYLRNLDISHNVITFEATESLAYILSQNMKLEELDISYNKVQTPGVINIFKSIQCTSTLTKLNIAHNMITDGATENLFNVIYNNSKLKELNISCNSPLEKDIVTKIILNATEGYGFIEQATSKLSAFNTNLQELNLSNMDLQMTGVVEDFKELGKYICTLTKFNISKNFINLSGADALAKFLSENNELQELDLSQNDLQESGIIRILDAIKHSNVTKLNISANDVNLEATVEVFLCFTKLEKLDLSCNRLNDAKDTISFFSKTKNIFLNLIKLNVAEICHEINDEAAEALACIFSQNSKLKELDLSKNNLCSKAIMSILNELNPSTLIKFNISHNNITDEAGDNIANFLSKCTKLEVLDLSHNNLQDAGAIEICKTNISTLISFDISHNKISIEAADDVAKFLSYNSQIKEHNLSSNGLLELGMINIFKDMQVVQSVFNLSELNISNSSVMLKAVNELIAILLCNTNLKKLDMSCSNLPAPDVAKIFKGLRNISKLVKINVSHNMITDKAAENIATVLSRNNKLTSLDLSFSHLTTSDAIKIFKGMKNISNLRTLNVSHNSITDEAAENIATVLSCNNKLKSLDLNFNHLTASGTIKICKGMKNISNLAILNIGHNMITDEAAEYIATVLFHNPNLKSFNLSSNYFKSNGFVKIFDYMRNIMLLKKLNISGNEITAKAGHSIAIFLSHNINLEELDLSNNWMEGASSVSIFKSLRNISGLTKLRFSGNMITHEPADHIATVLMHNAKLKEIDMSGNELLSIGTTKIFCGMKNIRNLKQVNISQNYITSKAADDIANVLSQNTNLQELYLSNNYLQASGIITMLSKMSNITKITHLDISSNKITDEAADNIALFLLHNKHLDVLDLSDNLIQSAGAKTIFGRKNINFNLKKLNFSGNALDDEAADIIGTFLSQNLSLKEFNLGSNYLQALGAVKIFRAIQNCPNILKLNMSNNKITDKAADEIAAVLSTVTKLREVDLDCNLLSAKMSDYIKRAFIKLPNLSCV